MAGILGMIGAQVAQEGLNQLHGAQEYKRTQKLMDIQQGNQMELMNMQMRNQQQLNAEGQALQMKTWEQTNYPAQVAMLKQAGLNPALLYAKGGAGGTTGGQGGGSAASGSAASGSAPRVNPMEITNIMQMRTMEAQAKAMEADARLKNADARIKEEFGGGQAQADINLKGAETLNRQVDTEFKQIQVSNSQKQIDASVENIKANTAKALTEGRILEGQAEDILKQTAINTMQRKLELELTGANIAKTEQDTKKMATEITVMLSQNTQRWTQLSIQEQQLELDKIVNKFNTNLPMRIGQWTGIIGNLLQGAKGIVGSKGGGITINTN